MLVLIQSYISKFYFDLKIEGGFVLNYCICFCRQASCATMGSLKGSIPSHVITN